MKHVLIFTSGKSKDGINSAERFGYVQDFCDNVSDKMDNVRVEFTTYDDIEVTIQDGIVEMYDHKNKLDLKKVAMVHFKNWVNDMQTAGMLARFFDSNSIPYFNSEVNRCPARNKSFQMVLLATNGLPVPDTFIAGTPVIKKLFAEHTAPKGFVLPFVIKADDGAKGNDNFLVRSEKDFDMILAKLRDDCQYVIQSFLPNDGDYRFLYVGLDATPMVFLRKSTGNTHLNNTSQGGTGELVATSDVSPDLLLIAKQSAELLGREIGGVDILIDKTANKPYVLEVNQTPALATGYNVPLKIKKFVGLLEDTIEVEEEE